MTAETREVPNSPQDVCPLLTRIAVPGLVLKSADSSDFDLTKAVNQQLTVVVFYRGGW